MPYTEYLGWIAYFEKRPIDWRDDYRTYLLMSQQGLKKSPGEVFSSLKTVFAAQDGTNEDGSIRGDNLRNSSVFNLLKGAKFGDTPDFLFRKDDENKDGNA